MGSHRSNNKCLSYNNSLKLWETWWKSIAKPHSWHHILDNSFHDGNPILWATNGNKIIRVISYIDETWHEENFSSWYDTTADGTKELVICCKPNEENLTKTQTLVKDWIEIE